MSKSNNNFEMDLYLIFKRYGYLFPTSEEEVERFERLHGTTDIEMPGKFKSPDSIIASIKAGSGDTSETEMERTYAMAAKSGKNLQPEILKKMRADRSKAVAKVKSKRT